MISSNLEYYFKHYTPQEAPFMHHQLSKWGIDKPLAGLRVLHHVPLVQNTLLKIACLVAAGAEVTVTNPSSFMIADAKAIECLKKSSIRYVDHLLDLKKETFDLYFDCGAELYQALGDPKVGAIELTGTGDIYYRQQKLDFPVVSIDQTRTKQLETIFGTAESASLAIHQLTAINPAEKSWLIFGFGKIGRGLAYFCHQYKTRVKIVELSPENTEEAKQLGLTVIHPADHVEIQAALKYTDIVVTATGKANIFADYSSTWFENKILANMGILDEFGPQIPEKAVLNNKKAVNFVLKDPTPMKYIDPEFYAHNMAALQLLSIKNTRGIQNLLPDWDEKIIREWCQFHQVSSDEIEQWFIRF